MTKRRVENEIEGLSEEILGDLAPEHRLQLVLETKAEEKDQLEHQLMESCSQRKYKGADREFVDRFKFAQRFIECGVYELHTTYLQYEITRQRQSYTQLLSYEQEEYFTKEDLEQAAQQAKALQDQFTDLYTNYHAHQRFATEILDVDLEAWLALHYEGPIVFEVVSELIDDQHMIELAESHPTEVLGENGEAVESDQTTSEVEPVTLDEMTDLRYETMVSDWEDAIAEIPS